LKTWLGANLLKRSYIVLILVALTIKNDDVTMMSLRPFLLLLLLVFGIAQEECQCDDAIAAATADAQEKKDDLASQLSTIESHITASQSELKGCEAKLVQLGNSEAEWKQKMDALTKEKEDLQGQVVKLDSVVKELEEARVVMNDAAVKAKEVDAELKAIHEDERILLRKAEQALIKVDGELNEALDQMKLIKKLKRERYVNFGSLWGQFVAGATGKKADSVDPMDLLGDLVKQAEQNQEL